MSSIAEFSETAQVSWRDSLPVHPAAELFPPMSAAELRELGADIRKRGLLSPIALYKDDFDEPEVLLDGRNRLDALELELGRPVRVVRRAVSQRSQYKPWTLECDDDNGEPVPVVNLFQDWPLIGNLVEVVLVDDSYGYVISTNIRRRHLTTEQKRELIEALIKAQPEKSNRQLAKAIGVSHPHLAKVRKELEKAGDVETVSTSLDTRGRQQPAKRGWSKERWRKHREKRKQATAAHDRASMAKYAEFVAEFEAADDDGKTSDRTDIGPASGGEVARLQAVIDDLNNKIRQRDLKILGLEIEVADLRRALAEAKPAAAVTPDDGIPDCLRRAPSTGL